MDDKNLGVAELRTQLGQRVDAAHFLGEVTVISKAGQPRAALVPFHWYAEVVAREPVRRPR